MCVEGALMGEVVEGALGVAEYSVCGQGLL